LVAARVAAAAPRRFLAGADVRAFGRFLPAVVVAGRCGRFGAGMAASKHESAGAAAPVDSSVVEHPRIDLATPALLFPAISLLLLAYTNRFLGLASLIRGLAARYAESRDHILIGQIQNLRHRLALIRRMQACGVASIFLCVLCMFALFAGSQGLGKGIFATSLVLLMISLGLSFREIQLSTHALTIQLSSLEKDLPPPE
jgi:hypothetical protein